MPSRTGIITSSNLKGGGVAGFCAVSWGAAGTNNTRGRTRPKIERNVPPEFEPEHPLSAGRPAILVTKIARILRAAEGASQRNWKADTGRVGARCSKSPDQRFENQNGILPR